MARYRKIDVRMWGDGKFRSLTPIPPCGQGLWIYLLTSPYTTNIPGLYRASEGALADDLHWPVREFRKAYSEAADLNMVMADWGAPLVFVPNAIEYNPPESPNVVKSWRNTWDEIPEVPLKSQAWVALKAFTEGLAEAFAKAFAEGCPAPPGARSDIGPKASFVQSGTGTGSGTDLPPKAPQGGGDGFREFYRAYPVHKGPDRAERAYRAALKRGATPEAMLAALRREESERAELLRAGRFVREWPYPASWLNAGSWKDEPANGGPRPDDRHDRPGDPDCSCHPECHEKSALRRFCAGRHPFVCPRHEIADPPAPCASPLTA